MLGSLTTLILQFFIAGKEFTLINVPFYQAGSLPAICAEVVFIIQTSRLTSGSSPCDE